MHPKFFSTESALYAHANNYGWSVESYNSDLIIFQDGHKSVTYYRNPRMEWVKE
jgi:hypothetical protein